MNKKNSQVNMNKEPFDQQKYVDEYKKQKYDRVAIYGQKGMKEKLQRIADEHGTSINKIVITAIENTYCIKLTKSDE